jgi:hypothetical protein
MVAETGMGKLFKQWQLLSASSQSLSYKKTDSLYVLPHPIYGTDCGNNTLVTVGAQGFLLSQCSLFPIQLVCCKKRQQRPSKLPWG